jgi:hypothetical protein
MVDLAMLEHQRRSLIVIEAPTNSGEWLSRNQKDIGKGENQDG